MKIFITVLVLLAIGGGLAWFGYSQTKSQVVTCGSDVIEPGDLCQSSDGTLTDYDEELADQRVSGWVAVGLGGAVALVGVVVLVGSFARGGRTAAAG